MCYTQPLHVSSSRLQGEGNDCFYPITGYSCNQTNNIIRERKHGNSLMPSPQAQGHLPQHSAWMQEASTHHAHGADMKVLEYYTQETADLAFLMLQKDLEAFGYPRLVVGSHPRPAHNTSRRLQ